MKADLHVCHDPLNLFIVQLEYAIQDRNFVVPEWLFTVTMELQEGPIENAASP